MSNSPRVLVSGATGVQGGSVARTLLGHSAWVRAFTRNPASEAAAALAAAGAEVVQGDFDDPVSLKSAASGMDSVFVMGTPFGTDPDTETRQAIALIEAAREAGVGHVVYSSVASALDGTGVPHFESKAAVERHLADVDVAHTVIAPAAFLGDLEPDALAAGRHMSVVAADVPLQQVAIDDLAAFTDLVIEQPERFAGERVELASFETSAARVASLISERIGREVRVQQIPIESIREQGGDDFVRMIEFFSAGGYTIDIPALHADYPEIDWLDPEDWVESQVAPTR